MFKMYILELIDGSYYVGSTEDLDERLDKHTKGRVKSTKNKLPLKLVYEESFTSRSDAQSREYQIKKWKSRRAIERLFKNKNKYLRSSFNG